MFEAFKRGGDQAQLLAFCTLHRLPLLSLEPLTSSDCWIGILAFSNLLSFTIELNANPALHFWDTSSCLSNASKWHVVARPEGQKQHRASHMHVQRIIHLCHKAFISAEGHHNSVPKLGRPTPTEIYLSGDQIDGNGTICSNSRDCDVASCMQPSRYE